ncbi:AT-hook motif nuclear-localized protein 20-like [Vigna radiata var. radiata]|uniref:AT-hook motif nuclear-localized protein n=1 Tax=Vigna radiata var. radiata TaxID=3916 RepID=A0A1S3TCG4_VIGRR|nr:AT-hook motif nuclear-localized protein 20-like [Vigna radiata var. radiata]
MQKPEPSSSPIAVVSETSLEQKKDDPRSEKATNMSTTSKPRGRPLGSKNKPKPASVRSPDTHNLIESHMIEITSGTDIIDNLVQFARRKKRGFCVLSAIGSIRNVTLQQSLIPDTIMTLEGQLQILSLKGSFLPGVTPPTLSVYLAGAKGQVVGGNVVGPLVASGRVFIVLASFSNAAFDRLPFVLEGNEEASSSNHQHHNNFCPSNLP